MTYIQQYKRVNRITETPLEEYVYVILDLNILYNDDNSEIIKYMLFNKLRLDYPQWFYFDKKYYHPNLPKEFQWEYPQEHGSVQRIG